MQNYEIQNNFSDAQLAAQLERFPKLSYYVSALKQGTLIGQHSWNNLGMLVAGLSYAGHGNFGLAKMYIAFRATGRA